jgi:hypothetical protein
MLLSLLLRLGTTRSKAPDLVAMAGLLLLVLPAFPEYADYDHHTLQIVPFLAFGVGRLMDVVASRSAASAPPWRFAILAGSIALAVAIGGISISANWRTSFISARTNTGISQAQEKHAAESQLSTFLRNLPLKYRTTLALQDHFVFWNANLDPVLPEAVHPSMLTNPQVLQVLYGKKIGDTGIIQKALARSPEIVLRVPGPITPEADSELRAALHRRYDLIAEIDNVEVWKLSP